MMSDEPDSRTGIREAISRSGDLKSSLLRGGEGALWTFGVGLTETYLYPYSVQEEPLEFSGGHRSWYFSSGFVAAFDLTVYYFDFTVRGNSLDRVPSMLNLTDQGGVCFFVSFGASVGMP